NSLIYRSSYAHHPVLHSFPTRRSSDLPTHPLDPALRRAKWETGEPIVIEDNVWLGGGAIVLPGVTIGRDAVVGAGAVVTRDVPPGAVVVGNPARVVRRLGEGGPTAV